MTNWTARCVSCGKPIVLNEDEITYNLDNELLLPFIFCCHNGMDSPQWAIDTAFGLFVPDNKKKMMFHISRTISEIEAMGYEENVLDIIDVGMIGNAPRKIKTSN